MPTIRVDRQSLTYVDGDRQLQLYVEWSAVAKTPDCPIDFEVSTDGDDQTWTDPPNLPIEPAHWQRILDEIAEYYSRGPIADIIGKRGELLRGQSTFRFSLQLAPAPSRYYEVGRFLAIPMAPMIKGPGNRTRHFLNFEGITEWTSPKQPISVNHLRLIAKRVAQEGWIEAVGLPPPA